MCIFLLEMSADYLHSFGHSKKQALYSGLFTFTLLDWHSLVQYFKQKTTTQNLFISQWPEKQMKKPMIMISVVSVRLFSMVFATTVFSIWMLSTIVLFTYISELFESIFVPFKFVKMLRTWFFRLDWKALLIEAFWKKKWNTTFNK